MLYLSHKVSVGEPEKNGWETLVFSESSLVRVNDRGLALGQISGERSQLKKSLRKVPS